MLDQGIYPHTKSKTNNFKPKSIGFGMGVYNIYKPKGPTSYDIIRQIKRDAADKKIGHGGTLDPLASGVLIVAIGREFTKQLDEISRGEKEYEATIKLGQTSTTQDEEGEKTNFDVDKVPNRASVEKVLNEFTGKVKQIPSQFSALKIKGQPAYKLARRGEKVELKEREIEIRKIELISYKYPILKIRVICSSGTYIRTLANDIGIKLKTGGYLSDLVRTRVSGFKLGESIKIE
ncbi:MAG: tRNA pseudouridine(55) synthase TruB [bacterium]